MSEEGDADCMVLAGWSSLMKDSVGTPGAMWVVWLEVPEKVLRGRLKRNVRPTGGRGLSVVVEEPQARTGSGANKEEQPRGVGAEGGGWVGWVGGWMVRLEEAGSGR